MRNANEGERVTADVRDPLIVPAPAKINLFLHVTGRRGDGYHTIETLFALIDLHDTITLCEGRDGVIARTTPLPDVPASDDLSLRAAHALRAATGVRNGVTIGVDKRIPIGGGLGGGSSDAATVLLALNRMWRLRLPRTELRSIGAALGADVPFFVGGQSALARGIGEVLVPVSLPRCWLALAMPSVRIATASIFAAPELTRSTPSAKMHVLSEGYGRNDLEAVAAARFPVVGGVVAALRRTSPAARMTGSGACAFAAFSSEHDAMHALSHLAPDVEGRVVRTLAHHPLLSFA